MSIERFRFIAYRIYRSEKSRDILDDAIALGYESRRVLDSLLNGEKQHLTIDFLQQWYKITNCKEILEAMLEGTGHIPVKMVTGKASSGIYQELLNNHDSLSDLHGSIKTAMADGRISPAEREDMMKMARQNRQQAADIEESIKEL